MKDNEDSSTPVESRGNAEIDNKGFFGSASDEHYEVKIDSKTASNLAVTWEASEYIHHQKSAFWYIALTGATIVLGGALFLLIKDVWSLAVLAVMYLAIFVFAKKEPRVLKYSIGAGGVSAGERHFTFDQFKSFSVMQETGVPSISLDPTQRFMPAVSMYFSPSDGDKIVDELAKFLPHEHKTLSAIDRAMLKLRF